jgi:hypothetical protein
VAGYKSFDVQWFWGYFSLGLVGLFVYFSRDQRLPIFGTRIASYLFLTTTMFFSVYLFVYFQKVTKKHIARFVDKERKNKYLKR